jgi:hypothetical protein
MHIYILEFEQPTDGHYSQITHIKLSSGEEKNSLKYKLEKGYLFFFVQVQLDLSKRREVSINNLELLSLCRYSISRKTSDR